jgi:hypothetical protein
MQYELLIEPEVHEARKRLPGHVRQQVKRALGGKVNRMSLYIYRMVIDTNCINARGTLPEMNELESFFDLCIIEIVKTSAFIEIQGYSPGWEKAKSYGTLYGNCWIGHTEEWSQGVGRKSNFEVIYKTLWGKMWKKGGAFQDKIHKQSLIDAIHLDICWINRADFFVTDEHAIIGKREELYRQGFDVKIVSPPECVAYLKATFKQDFGTDDVAIISQRIQNARPILLGSNDCRVAFIQDPKTGETLFRTHWIDNQLHIEANLYDSAGAALVKLKPKQEPVVLHADATVGLHDVGPKTFYMINPETPNPPVEQYLRIGDSPASQFAVEKGGEIFLSGHIVPSGHIVFEGRFFNARGELVAEIEKKSLKYFGLSFINSGGDILPSIVFS